MGSAPPGHWKSLCITHLATCPNQNSPTDSLTRPNLAAQSCKLYHLGVGVVTRSSLARVNAEKPWEMYEELHGRLLGRCQAKAPGHGYRFKAKLFSVDSTTLLSHEPYENGPGTPLCWYDGVKTNRKHEGTKPVAHNDTVFAQVLKLVPRHEFERLARKHKSGRMSRSMTRWGQFVAMGMAQLTGR